MERCPSFKKIINEKTDELLEEDKTESFLNDFYTDAEEKIKEIRKKLELIDKEYVNIAKLCGENADKFTLVQFVDTFRKYTKNLFESKKKYKEKMILKKI